MKKYLAIGFTSLVMVGCSSIGTQFVKMSEPTSGERARMRVHTNMLVKGVPESSCVDWSKEGAGTIFGGIVGSSGYRGRTIDMPNPNNLPSKKSGEFYIRADKPFTTVLVTPPDSRAQCSIAVSFVPKENHDYEMTMSLNKKGVISPKVTCSAIVFDITGGKYEPVALETVNSCRN